MLKAFMPCYLSLNLIFKSLEISSSFAAYAGSCLFLSPRTNFGCFPVTIKVKVANSFGVGPIKLHNSD